MNSFKFLYFSLTLLISNIYHSQLISDKWYQLYNSEGVSVEINFSISEDGCNNGYPTIFKYRYNGKLLPYDKYIDWKLDYTNCNGQIYTYSSGAKIGGYNIQNELGKGLLEDFIKEEFDDAITSKKIISNLYDVSTSYTKSFSNKIKTSKVLNGLHAKKYDNGDFYEGNFKNGKFDGFGKLESISNGEKIKTIGEWKNNEFIKGTVHINDKLFGEYKNGEYIPYVQKDNKSLSSKNNEILTKSKDEFVNNQNVKQIKYQQNLDDNGKHLQLNKVLSDNIFSFNDDFNNGNKNEWDLTNAHISEYSERLCLEGIGTKYEYVKSCLKFSSFSYDEDFLIETEFYFSKKGILNPGSGIIFASDEGNDNFYCFTINKDGYYHIFKVENGNIIYLSDSEYESSNSINKGKYINNKLSISNKNSELEFLINNQSIFNLKNLNSYGPYYGLISFEKNCIDSKNFKIENY